MSVFKKFPKITFIVLLSTLIGVWIAFLTVKKNKESLNISCEHLKKIHHLQFQHQNKLKTYMERFQQLRLHNKLKLVETSEAEEFLKNLCQRLKLQIQDLRIKGEEEKTFSELPIFHCLGHIGLVLKVENLQDFHDFIQTLCKDFPGIVVYKTLKISKILNTTNWVGLVDFSYFNVDINDYMVVPSEIKPVSPETNDSRSFDKPKQETTFLLKAILYSSPQDWTIWLNDQKISIPRINDMLTITKVTPTAVHFVTDTDEILIVEPGDRFQMDDLLLL